MIRHLFLFINDKGVSSLAGINLGIVYESNVPSKHSKKEEGGDVMYKIQNFEISLWECIVWITVLIFGVAPMIAIMCE